MAVTLLTCKSLISTNNYLLRECAVCKIFFISEEGLFLDYRLTEYQFPCHEFQVIGNH